MDSNWRFEVTENLNDRFDFSCEIECRQGANPLARRLSKFRRAVPHVYTVYTMFNRQCLILFRSQKCISVRFYMSGLLITYISRKNWGSIKSFIPHFVDYWPVLTFLLQISWIIWLTMGALSVCCSLSRKPVVVGWRHRMCQTYDLRVLWNYKWYKMFQR